jgi:hypothetical protein
MSKMTPDEARAYSKKMLYKKDPKGYRAEVMEQTRKGLAKTMAARARGVKPKPLFKRGALGLGVGLNAGALGTYRQAKELVTGKTASIHTDVKQGLDMIESYRRGRMAGFGLGASALGAGALGAYRYAGLAGYQEAMEEAKTNPDEFMAKIIMPDVTSEEESELLDRIQHRQHMRNALTAMKKMMEQKNKTT